MPMPAVPRQSVGRAGYLEAVHPAPHLQQGGLALVQRYPGPPIRVERPGARLLL